MRKRKRTKNRETKKKMKNSSMSKKSIRSEPARVRLQTHRWPGSVFTVAQFHEDALHRR